MSRFVIVSIALVISTLLFSLSTSSVGQTLSPSVSSDFVLILDASGSMWGQVEGENKIVIARRVLKNLVASLSTDSEVGLVAYGHRKKGDCEDIETLVPLGALDKDVLGQRIDALDPKGKTPITKAVQEVLEVLQSREDATTVVLVSDGLETCGGDPCQAIREAKAAGVAFVAHVVGFDVGEGDVSQLECIAQEGGGLFFSARNAGELATALEHVVAAPTELPEERLSVQAMKDGELADALIVVTQAETGQEVARGRTYTEADTNPRIFPLIAGSYDIDVRALSIKGQITQSYKGVELRDGEIVERVADFSTGELAIQVTRNGALSDATVNVFVAGTKQNIARGRTYTKQRTNPHVFQLTGGTYDVVVKTVEVDGRPEHRFSNIHIQGGGGRVEHSHDFASGMLQVGAVHAGALVDVTVQIRNAEGAVAQGRTYAKANTNPKTFILSPGDYTVVLKAVKLKDKPSQEIAVTIESGQRVEKIIDFAE